MLDIPSNSTDERVCRIYDRLIRHHIDLNQYFTVVDTYCGKRCQLHFLPYILVLASNLYQCTVMYMYICTFKYEYMRIVP